jgi:hypothetical protein
LCWVIASINESPGSYPSSGLPGRKVKLTKMTANAKLNLDHVPPEVAERIIQYLDLNTIKNIRLTSKALAGQCLGLHFKSFFKQQKTDLTERSLQRLRVLAAHPELGGPGVVRNLTIVATVYNSSEVQRILSTKQQRVVGSSSSGTILSTSYKRCTEEELSAAQSDLAWLRAQQAEQEALSDESAIDSLASALKLFERLDSIDLDATVIQRPNLTVSTTAGEWHPIWIRASQVYCLSMSAVARSGVAVETVTIYRNTPRCSVPSCDITAHVRKLDADCCLASIKNFALSTSTKIETDFRKIAAAGEQLQGAKSVFHEAFGSTAGLLKADDPEALAEDNFPGIARLLKLMPNLEAIDLHLYRTLNGHPRSYDRIFQAIAEEIRLPSTLEQCFLRGIFTTEQSLLQFLTNHPRINHLDLREICLTSGSWEAIFEYVSAMPNLRRLRLSNLWDNDGMLTNLYPVRKEHFDREADLRNVHPTFFSCVGDSLVHTREFDVHDLKEKGLKFRPRVDGRPRGSLQFMLWMQARDAEYGPPVRHGDAVFK